MMKKRMMNQILITLLFVAVMSWCTANIHAEVMLTIDSYDFTPDTPEGIGWAADESREKLTDGDKWIVGDGYASGRTTAWYLPAGTGPEIILELGSSQEVDMLMIS